MQLFSFIFRHAMGWVWLCQTCHVTVLRLTTQVELLTDELLRLRHSAEADNDISVTFNLMLTSQNLVPPKVVSRLSHFIRQTV